MSPAIRLGASKPFAVGMRSIWQPAAETARPPATREPIVITAERIRLLQSDFEQRWGTPPTQAQLRALVDHAVEDEMLYREARVLALGFEDGSVRRRLKGSTDRRR